MKRSSFAPVSSQSGSRSLLTDRHSVTGAKSSTYTHQNSCLISCHGLARSEISAFSAHKLALESLLYHQIVDLRGGELGDVNRLLSTIILRDCQCR